MLPFNFLILKFELIDLNLFTPKMSYNLETIEILMILSNQTVTT